MNHVKCRKFLAMALALSLLTVPVPMTANAVEPETTTEPKETVEEFVLPDMIDPAEAKQNGYIGRAYDEEPNLSTLVFKNEDGTNTLRAFSYPVKYVDENGKTRDISLKLKETENGGLVTADNNVITTFSKELSGGISLEYEDISVRLVPEMAEGQDIPVALSEDSKTAVYTLDGQTALSYALTCTGFKEDIVVSEYTGQTDYGFTLYTGGLELWEFDGSYFLRDETGEVRANIGDVIVFTADEKNNTMGSMSAETVSENEEYRLTIHVDDEYLASPETVYPIRIDPTIEINKPSDGMQDTTIYSGDNTTTYGTDTKLVVGKTQYKGIARSLIRFAGNNFNYIHSSLNVNSATLDITSDGSGSSGNMVVECYMFEGAMWSQSTAKWNNVNADNYSSCIASKSFPSSGITKSYNVIYAVKRWVDARCDESDYRTSFDPDLTTGAFNMKTGLLFKAVDSVENGANLKYKSLYSSNNSTNKPSLTVNYTGGILRNEFFSKYDPDKFNIPDDITESYPSKAIQYRMNCYGYAFSTFFDSFVVDYGTPEHNPIYGAYLQQPGEFVYANFKSQLKNVGSTNDLSEELNKIKYNIILDASHQGYNVYDYTPTNSTLSQFNNDSRLVALVDSNNNNQFRYHFYMQHSDGTWSHKDGNGPVQNTSLDVNEFILTNENILNLANTGKYANGCIKFLEITKKPTFDHRHSSRCCNSFGSCNHNVTTSIYTNDNAGDYFENAVDILSGSSNAQNMKMSYNKDVDMYYFSQLITGTYRITAVRISGTGINTYSDLDCKVYSASGMLLYSDVRERTLMYDSYGDVELDIQCSGGSQYFIEIFNKNNNNMTGSNGQNYSYEIKIERLD